MYPSMFDELIEVLGGLIGVGMIIKNEKGGGLLFFVFVVVYIIKC